MNAKKRYALVLTSVAFLAFCYFGGHRLKDRKATRWKAALSRFSPPDNSNILGERTKFLKENVLVNSGSSSQQHSRPVPSSEVISRKIDPTKQIYQNCGLDSCFNLTKCQNKQFRVYVYPFDEHVPPSESYSKILNTLKESNYYTSNPEEACLFVLSLDTLDRDPLSNFDFVRNMPSRIAKLDHWNGGEH